MLRLLRKPSERIRSRDDATIILKAIFDRMDADREHVVVLALDPHWRSIGFKVVASGTRRSVSVQPRAIIQDAVRLGAHGIVVAHNHPSGRKGPSAMDIPFGHKLRELGQAMGVKVHDQIVIVTSPGPRLANGWSDDETEQLIALAAAGMPLRGIKAQLQRTRAEIIAKADELAISLPGRKTYR